MVRLVHTAGNGIGASLGVLRLRVRPARSSGCKSGALLEVLRRAGRPLTVAQLMDAGDLIYRGAVHRALAGLVHKGQVRRLPGWPARYEVT